MRLEQFSFKERRLEQFPLETMHEIRTVRNALKGKSLEIGPSDPLMIFFILMQGTTGYRTSVH